LKKEKKKKKKVKEITNGFGVKIKSGQWFADKACET
jgi:hypothetical protein